MKKYFCLLLVWAMCFVAVHSSNAYDFSATLTKAEQGDATAQCNLGEMYYKGEGVALDYTEAVKWYRRAAEQGLAVAEYALGYSYTNGHGVVKDAVAAKEWFRKSARNGCDIAKKYLDLIGESY